MVDSLEDMFGERSLSLEFLEINRQTGEFSSYVLWGAYSEVPERGSQDRLIYESTQALKEFFSHFGLEFRDVITEKVERPAPLEELVRLRANLVPTDTVMPLEEILTEEVTTKLHDVGTSFCTTTARATIEPILHRGIVVNFGVTLRPCEGDPAFKLDPHKGKGAGTPEAPLRQDDGSVYFVLQRPFDEAKHVEIDLGAIEVRALLLEIDTPEGS